MAGTVGSAGRAEGSKGECDGEKTEELHFKDKGVTIIAI